MSLPAELAQFIPVKDHPQAGEALARFVADSVQQAEEALRRHLVALIAGDGLEEAPQQVEELPRIEASNHHWARGCNHQQFLATFRARFPKGEEDIRAYLANWPPGTKLSAAEHNRLKAWFGMGTRSLLLAPMLRELGCTETSSGRWITPFLQIVSAEGR
jgi:uncharacterized protein with von Willebrand factor type A (vWA) domain